MKIAEFPKKKRKLSLRNGEGGEREKKRNERNCFCPFKFATIKKDFRSIIRDKRDFYNTFFIRLSLFER
jgi:hypothetical protein